MRLEGGMSLDARDRAIEEFTHDPKVCVCRARARAEVVAACLVF